MGLHKLIEFSTKIALLGYMTSQSATFLRYANIALLELLKASQSSHWGRLVVN